MVQNKDQTITRIIELLLEMPEITMKESTVKYVRLDGKMFSNMTLCTHDQGISTKVGSQGKQNK